METSLTWFGPPRTSNTQLNKWNSSFMGANAEVDAARGDANAIREEDYMWTRMPVPSLHQLHIQFQTAFSRQWAGNGRGRRAVYIQQWLHIHQQWWVEWSGKLRRCQPDNAVSSYLVTVTVTIWQTTNNELNISHCFFLTPSITSHTEKTTLWHGSSSLVTTTWQGNRVVTSLC